MSSIPGGGGREKENTCPNIQYLSSTMENDKLVTILRSLKIGCHIKTVFMAALLYADDMALLSPSLRGLQWLLNVCSEYCKEWDIALNAKKSKLMYFGKPCNNLLQPKLNNLPLD